MRVLLIVLGLLSAGSASAEIYKWTDENGAVHFSDKAPAQVRSESVHIDARPGFDVPAQDTGGPEAPAEAPAAKKKQALDVVMYATKTCGYCRKARAFFSERGIAWQEVDIESSSAAHDEFKSKGGQGVPLIFINGQRVQGFSKENMQAVVGQYGY
jgi:glutaredoxin